MPIRAPASVVAAVLVAAGAVAGASAGQPRRLGPVVTVFAGSDWSVVAWASSAGTCTSYGAPGVSGFGCSRPPRRPLDLLFAGGGLGSETRIVGTVSPRVARVEILAAGGRVAATIRAELPQLRTARRFFLARSPGPLGRFAVRAFDAHGRLLERT